MLIGHGGLKFLRCGEGGRGRQGHRNRQKESQRETYQAKERTIEAHAPEGLSWPGHLAGRPCQTGGEGPAQGTWTLVCLDLPLLPSQGSGTKS